VFGEGDAHAVAMFVGEQPGDAEDRAGHPFVGPAGKLLRDAMAEAGIDPERAYITNAVKHFKFVERGKRRIHAKPNRIEVRACEAWLQAEIAVVKPQVLVALGATAAQALFGPSFRVTAERGRDVPTTLAPHAFATVHPSSILRAPDPEARHSELARFVDDLRIVAGAIGAAR
jgi:DNA polymerase